MIISWTSLLITLLSIPLIYSGYGGVVHLYNQIKLTIFPTIKPRPRWTSMASWEGFSELNHLLIKIQPVLIFLYLMTFLPEVLSIFSYQETFTLLLVFEYIRTLEGVLLFLSLFSHVHHQKKQSYF